MIKYDSVRFVDKNWTYEVCGSNITHYRETDMNRKILSKKKKVMLTLEMQVKS